MSDAIQSAAGRRQFAEKMERGEFVVTCEIVPPKAPSFSPLDRRCELLRGHVDAINVTDCASAVLRMTPLAASIRILENGLEPIMQTTCRDRNRLSLQADLIGAWALGVRHIMALTGDFIHLGDHPSAKPVFDLDSVNYLLMLSELKQGRYFSGDPIQVSSKSGIVPMEFTIGAAANPFGVESRYSALHLNKKAEAGAEFFQTQPVFDLDAFGEWAKVVGDTGLLERARLIVGVMPVKSARGLSFMKQEVPGVVIPDALLQRFEQAADARAEGIEVAKETLDVIMDTPGVAGVHFMPVGWEEVVPDLVAHLRSRLPETGRAGAQVVAMAGGGMVS